MNRAIASGSFYIWGYMIQNIFDCVIIGGGPAGLTAAEYLGRFLRKTLVIDSGKSRAALIPTSHNYPGFAKGVGGKEFLSRLREQASAYDINFHDGLVERLEIEPDGTFAIMVGTDRIAARKVIIASGIVDRDPVLKNIRQFVYDGVIRYCPICDGYEAKDKVVGIIGPCAKIYLKACFLRTYTSRIELFALDDDFACQTADLEKLASLKVALPTMMAVNVEASHDSATVTLADGTRKTVDILYPAMGAEIRTDYVQGLGLKVNETGCIYTDSHQQTNIPGLYAIGDVTLDLSQISVATGQAAIAATAIHTALPLNCRA